MYSGRGRRGGRGAHQYYSGRALHVVRGGGRGHDSLGGRSQRGRMSWVKSRDGVSSEAVKLSGTEDPKNEASSSPLEASAPSNQTVETDIHQKQQQPPTASGSGPILRGPRNHGQRWGGHGRSGRGFFQGRGSAGMNFHQKKKNTWRRDDSAQTAVERTKQEEENENQEEKRNQFGDVSEAEDAQIQNREENRTQMQTIGHANQVAGAKADKTKVQNPGKIQQSMDGSESQFADASDDDGQVVELQSQNNKEKEPIQAYSPEINKIARESTELNFESTKTVPAGSISSAAQLREQNETETALQEGMETTEHDKAEKPSARLGSPGKQQQQQRKMIHKGNNKLVLSAPESYRGGKQKTVTSPARYQYESHHGGRGGRRKRSPSPVPTAKRIKINAPEKEPASGAIKGEEGETTASAESKQGKKSSGVSATSETLTDFAYRSRFHSFGSGRGRGRGRGLNVGLVRVNPDETKTPICPTFLRGIRCENELCQKRHDVPIESARPVCSFFQRHGQCLKGSDCPFRHVKMNPLAMLCPSFNLLGYCDDEKCVMKHVAPNKSMRNDRDPKSNISIERSREGKA